jgi:hypothetical protein
MEETFTRDEVVQMLVSVIMFSTANNNQGTKDIKGVSFGEKAHHVINVHNSLKGSEKSMIGALSMLKRQGTAPVQSEFTPILID